MYSPSTRLLTLLELLQSRPVWGGAELAARLEVDARSVRRYITMLQDMGMPVEPVRGPGGGYRLRPGFKLPPLMFTEDEASAIVISMLIASGQQVNLSSVSVEGALAKVLRVLPLSARDRLGALAGSLRLNSGDAAPLLDAALLLTLSDAVQQHTRITLAYAASADRFTERTVEPYGLAGWWGNWYLVAYCCLRRGMRTFRLDRMRQVQRTDQIFTRPNDFDCHAFLAEQLRRAESAHAVSIRFDVPVDSLRDRIPAHYGTLRSTDHGALFETRYDDLAGLAYFLIGLNQPFVVLQPEALKTVLRTIVETLRASTAG